MEGLRSAYCRWEWLGSAYSGGSDWVLRVASGRGCVLATSGRPPPEEVGGTTTHPLPLSLALYKQLAIIPIRYAYQERTHQGAAIPPAAASEVMLASTW